MVGFISAGGGGFDYVQAGQPANPQLGEIWFDVDGGSDGTGEAKVYDGDQWQPTGYTAHGDLTGVTRDAHHPPVDVSGPLTQPSDQSLGLSIGDGLANSAGTLVAALGAGLTIDADGNIQIPANGVAQSMLGFDTATQSELDNAESALSTDITAVGNDLDAHAGSTGGVHGVASGDSVAGQDDVDAVTSALSDHESDTTNPHNVTDDQTGAAAALSDHESDTTNPHNVTDNQTGAATALSNHAGNNSAHHAAPEYNGDQFNESVGDTNGSWSTVRTYNVSGSVIGWYILCRCGAYVSADAQIQIEYQDGTTDAITVTASSGGNSGSTSIDSGPGSQFTSQVGKTPDVVRYRVKNNSTQTYTFSVQWLTNT
ncbi:hypothetical protein [Halolamina sp. C58]|uniref:hypothetical protein n=1 Tax=Halolamina sp. C58 TaxID=3421640 RepID=UPI003EBA3A2F